jgi:cell division protein ZapE
LCFDEFAVHEITDAMLLGRLFKYLFSEGVCVIATSNVVPDDLYRGGLQRDLFLEAIVGIKNNMHVVHAVSQTDHRLQHLHQAGVYYSPLGAHAEKEMEQAYIFFSKKALIEEKELIICDRKILTKACTHEVVWFEFANLCGAPRAKPDYLELAKYFKVVLVSNIKDLGGSRYDLTTNFIHLIDIFYDEKIKLVLSAELPIESLCQTGSLSSLFARTQSRLIEMQSPDYWDGLFCGGESPIIGF